MNNFFTNSNGEEIEESNTFESGGIQPIIPSGTQVLCAVAASEWTEQTEYKDPLVQITLHVLSKGPYKDFLVKDNLKVYDGDPKKADKAKAKLMAYDKMAKGLLLKTARAGKNIEGDNALLARALNGVEVLATFDEWEMQNQKTGEMMTGNWVRKIEPKPKALQEEDKAIEKKAKEMVEDDDFDASIPF
jgi:hypothetical protein